MSGKTKALIAVLILAMVMGVGIVSIFTVGIVASMSLRQAQQQAQMNASCAPGATPIIADAGGPVRLPVTGSFTPTSEFGMRIHPVLGQAKMHWGIDLAEHRHGGPIVAVKNGTIVEVASSPVAGNYVKIDHGGGLTTRYLHMAKTTVQLGQQVKVGQQVGIEGATGRVSGPHLHFEVKQGNGSPQDPRAWFATQGLVLPRPGQAGNAMTIDALSGATNANATTTPGTSSLARNAAATSTPAGVPAGQGIGKWSAEQVSNAAAIIKAGQALGADSHTLAIGVMTAIGESTLIVVDHGDAAGPDSRGLFQQRANGAWGSYADRMNPTISATNFFKALMAVPNYQSLPPTIAAHQTQHNQDPNHYAKFWSQAVELVSKITGDPALMAQASADGAGIPCTPGEAAGVPVNVGSMPGAPGQSCPATSSPAERGVQPATLRVLRCGAAAFPRVTTFYGVGSRPGPSDHPAGWAVDFMIPDYATPAGRAFGWQVARWMQAHAKELGINYIIFDMKTWSVGQADAGWRPYTRYGPNPDDNLGHRNHVHVSMAH